MLGSMLWWVRASLHPLSSSSGQGGVSWSINQLPGRVSSGTTWRTGRRPKQTIRARRAPRGGEILRIGRLLRAPPSVAAMNRVPAKRAPAGA